MYLVSLFKFLCYSHNFSSKTAVWILGVHSVDTREDSVLTLPSSCMSVLSMGHSSLSSHMLSVYVCSHVLCFISVSYLSPCDMHVINLVELHSLGSGIQIHACEEFKISK